VNEKVREGKEEEKGIEKKREKKQNHRYYKKKRDRNKMGARNRNAFFEKDNNRERKRKID
jgi:hypothetical protein